MVEQQVSRIDKIMSSQKMAFDASQKKDRNLLDQLFVKLL